MHHGKGAGRISSATSGEIAMMVKRVTNGNMTLKPKATSTAKEAFPAAEVPGFAKEMEKMSIWFIPP